jgi:decaprenylphospho-beta-D-erythro-pentofuranosid-2-ulose 2-reductase
MQRILIIGATSAIAEACARLFAARGDQLYLAARNSEKLAAIAADLNVRGSSIPGQAIFDANDLNGHAWLLEQASARMGGLDTVLIAHGTLSDQAACEQSVEQTLAEIQTNGLSVVALLTRIAQQFEAEGKGTIGVISSVAGDRGRQSNYVYGSAKALVSSFLSGLGQRLGKKGIKVINIKPGFVDTPMTAAFKKGALWAKPEMVAKGIVAAMDSGKPVAYVPGFWWLIMMIIKNIPERIFRKLSI